MTDRHPLSALEQECAALEAALEVDAWDGPILPPWTPPDPDAAPAAADRDRASALLVRLEAVQQRVAAERDAAAAELGQLPRRLAAATGYARHRAS